jgi:hypothetical protein
MTNIDVDQIEQMERGGLITLWQGLMDKPLPRHISIVFLRQVLAFEVQSKQTGGLPSGFIKRLNKQAGGSKPKRSNTEPKPGGRLLREWNGITHVVDIADGHYVWKGENYRSLSAIARAITGAHWSGPRFFGLNKKQIQ